MKYLMLAVFCMMFSNKDIGPGELEFKDVLNAKDVYSMEVKTLRQTENRYGALVEETLNYSYKHLNNSKELLLVERKEGHSITKYEYELDAQANVTRMQSIHNANPGNINIYEYDKAGNLVKHLVYTKDKKQKHNTFKFYSPKGLLMKDSSNFYQQEALAYNAVYTYQYEGLLLVERKKEDYTEKYEYDIFDRLISTSRFSEGNFDSKTETVYNDNNFIAKKYIIEQGKVGKRLSYENEIKIDKRGNWIELKRTGGLAKTVYRTITYN